MEATRTFELGQIVITAHALEVLDPEAMLNCLRRHAKGDWGELCEEARAENELSLREGFRLLSAYTDRNGNKFWIITEADRSITTILLTEDY